jgi:hypothetical protein
VGLRICVENRKAFAPARNQTRLLRHLGSYMFYRLNYFGLEAKYSVNKLSEAQKCEQYIYKLKGGVSRWIESLQEI